MVVKDKAEVDKSQMAVYLAELEQEKLVQSQRDALREYDKSQELAFWQAKLQGTDVVEKDRLNILTRTAKLEIEILRDKARQGVALNAEQRKAAEARALASIDAAQTEARGLYSLGAITNDQLLQLEAEHEQMRFQIRATALEAQKQLIDPQRDPVAYAQILAQIEALEAQHLMRKREMQFASAQETSAPMRSVFAAAEASMAKAIEGMINRTMSLKQAMASIWAGIRGAIVKEIATIIARKVAAWAVERGLALMGIGAKAAEAGAGAASSVASIPYVGPILAIAALASVMAAVMGAKSSVPSARGGFDIPAGINPMTQLHEREMVLPAKQADVIRDMADRGAGTGGGLKVTLKAAPLKGNFFVVHRDDMLAALKGAQRDHAW